MSTKPWQAPTWMTAEQREAEERLLKALRDVIGEARDAAHRLETASDVSAWEARMTGATKDAEEWVGRFNRLAPPPTVA